MATIMKRLPARVTATQRAMINGAGPVGVASRALLWLGAGIAGQTISPAGRREIASLLADETLAPGVLVALQQLYDRLGDSGATGDIAYGTSGDTPRAVTRGTTRAVTPPEPGPAAPAPHISSAADEDDPFADAGREFED